MNTIVKTLGLVVVVGLLSALAMTGCNKADTDETSLNGDTDHGMVDHTEAAMPMETTAQAGSTDAAMPRADPAAEAVKPYPLTTCLVTGEELGSMGDPIIRVYDGQEIKFCCKGCIAKFEADKAKYLAMLPASE